jgi:hypothetical protein
MRTRSLSFAALLFLACAGSKPAGDRAATATNAPALSASERSMAVEEMERTRKAFLASLEGLTDAQYRYKPAPDRWSVAEVAEHIAVSEEMLLGMIKERILKAPASPELLSQVQPDSALLISRVTDRSTKVQAPEMLRPSGRFPTVDAVRAAFNQGRDKNIEFMKTAPENLHAYAGPHPVLKVLDGYQWLLLVSAHSSRHTAQILEVKADPKFPR